jgi:acetolactate synthase regulatory subunit
MRPETRLTLTTGKSLSVLLRVLNLLSQRGIDVREVRAEFRDDEVTVQISMSALPRHDTENLLGKISSLVEVGEVSLR